VTVTKGKPAWRAELLAARALVPPSVRAAEAAALASWLGKLLSEPSGALVGEPGTVCAYHPVGTEPGSALMLDTLVAAGCRVLLPVVAQRGSPLDWAVYMGADGLAAGAYGLPEPVGPRLGRLAVSAAGIVLVPALAVDRRGVRLGRGAGYYDRTLVLASPGASVIAIIRDCELVPRLPCVPHDVPMSAALTPTTGLVRLP
jgi:5-formyltetrahydrofolate cyclo-ligase